MFCLWLTTFHFNLPEPFAFSPLLHQHGDPFEMNQGFAGIFFFMHCCCLSEGSTIVLLSPHRALWSACIQRRSAIPVVTNSHSVKKTSLIHHATFQMFSCMLGRLQTLVVFAFIWLNSLLLCHAIPMAGLPTRKVVNCPGTPVPHSYRQKNVPIANGDCHHWNPL